MSRCPSGGSSQSGTEGIVYELDTLPRKAGDDSERFPPVIAGSCAYWVHAATTEHCQVAMGPVWDGAPSGKRFGEAVRGHWGIESMHWVLDVNFREDESRTRERTLANNLSWLRRFAVTLLKRHPDKDSLRGKMISCGLNTDSLSQVLSLQRV